MSLYVKGRVLCCVPRTFDKKDGSGKFTMHTCFVFDEGSNSEPVKVNSGEMALKVGENYRIPVYTSVYQGDAQLNATKDNPPQLLKA